MSALQKIEDAIQKLSPEELANLRQWFQEFDGEVWDRQIEQDAKAGCLDGMAEKALRELREGRTTDL